MDSLLAQISENYPGVKEVNVCGTQHRYAVKPRDVARLERAMRGNTHVKSLRLSHNSIGPGGAANIARILANNESIECVDLSWNRIGHEGSTAIAGALRGNRTLKVLKLGGNNIGDDGLMDLSGGLLENFALTEIVLTSNDIGAAGLTALSEALRGSGTGLSTLDLSWNALNEEGMASLADAIAKNGNLRFLNLSMCELSAESVRALAVALRSNTSVTSLDLSGNDIDGEVAKVLGDAFLDHPKIQNIDLKSNKVGEEGLKAVARLIEKRGKISINLRFNEINTDGAKAIAASIRRNPSCTRPVLRYLSIIRRSLANDTISVSQLKLFSYLTDIYIDFDKKEKEQRILLGAVYGAGIQQLLRQFHKEEINLVPLAFWRVGSKLRLDGFYELLRSKPELLRDAGSGGNERQ